MIEDDMENLVGSRRANADNDQQSSDSTHHRRKLTIRLLISLFCFGGVVLLILLVLPRQAPKVPETATYFLYSEVPWATVELNNKPLSSSIVASSAPLMLSNGVYTLAWAAEPFEEQRCIISVPSRSRDTCTVIAKTLTSDPRLSNTVIELHEPYTALTDTTRQALDMALQGTLHNVTSLSVMQPGEHYLLSPDTVALAPASLRATLHFDLASPLSSGDRCQVNPRTMMAERCEVEGQICSPACSLPWSMRSIPPNWTTFDPYAWSILFPVRASWDYATQSGDVIAHDQPFDQGLAAHTVHLALAQVTWDGLAWHPKVHLAPERSDFLVSDRVGSTWAAFNPVCVPALDALADSPSLSSYFWVRLYAGPTAGDGCVVQASLNHDTSSVGDPEYFERYGVTLAMNAAASRIRPDLPDGSEQEKQLAHQIMTT